jgi:hypothetical protein
MVAKYGDTAKARHFSIAPTSNPKQQCQSSNRCHAPVFAEQADAIKAICLP